MRWYFCINEALPRYEQMIRAAIVTAREKTSLEPHLLYDGPACEAIEDFKRAGVTVHCAHVDFLQGNPAYQGKQLAIAQGAFLRLLIPDFEREHEFVLYTDCDVLFRADLDLDAYRPKILAAAPESSPDDWSRFNSGVMVLNVEALKQARSSLASIAKPYPSVGTYDQGALNVHFRDRWDRLPAEYNWKTYWPSNPAARIIHYHGAKPEQMGRYLRGGPEAIKVEHKRRLISTMSEATLRDAISEVELAASRF